VTSAIAPTAHLTPRAALDLARAVLGDSYLASPELLSQLVSQMGVTITTAKLPGSINSTLDYSSGTILVMLREGLSPAERRFCAAHEIAHILIEHSTVGRSYIVRSNESFLESACDLVARELLIPADWLRNRVGASSPTLPLIHSIATDANSKDTIVARRMYDLGHKFAYARYESIDDDRWVLTFATGKPEHLASLRINVTAASRLRAGYSTASKQIVRGEYHAGMMYRGNSVIEALVVR
jgi:Zn-dependent peptidase ImmA (M78 family)